MVRNGSIRYNRYFWSQGFLFIQIQKLMPSFQYIDAEVAINKRVMWADHYKLISQDSLKLKNWDRVQQANLIE